MAGRGGGSLSCLLHCLGLYNQTHAGDMPWTSLAGGFGGLAEWLSLFFGLLNGLEQRPKLKPRHTDGLSITLLDLLEDRHRVHSSQLEFAKGFFVPEHFFQQQLEITFLPPELPTLLLVSRMKSKNCAFVAVPCCICRCAELSCAWMRSLYIALTSSAAARWS